VNGCPIIDTHTYVCRERQWGKTRVNTSSVFTQWRNLMECSGFSQNNQLAKFLLDREAFNYKYFLTIN
uniref:Uncharacterized protein n=1 Tax=Sinocyclocheilus anshuiensis TaxID=1608454 RepID=A0A671QB68_9TELE